MSFHTTSSQTADASNVAGPSTTTLATPATNWPNRETIEFWISVFSSDNEPLKAKTYLSVDRDMLMDSLFIPILDNPYILTSIMSIDIELLLDVSDEMEREALHAASASRDHSLPATTLETTTTHSPAVFTAPSDAIDEGCYVMQAPQTAMAPIPANTQTTYLAVQTEAGCSLPPGAQYTQSALQFAELQNRKDTPSASWNDPAGVQGRAQTGPDRPTKHTGRREVMTAPLDRKSKESRKKNFVGRPEIMARLTPAERIALQTAESQTPGGNASSFCPFPQCQRRGGYSTMSARDRHIRNSHLKMNTVVCDGCGKEVKRGAAMTNHQDVCLKRPSGSSSGSGLNRESSTTVVPHEIIDVDSYEY